MLNRNLFITSRVKLTMDLGLMPGSTLVKGSLIYPGSRINCEEYTEKTGLIEDVEISKMSNLKAGSILEIESTIIVGQQYVKFIDVNCFLDSIDLGIKDKKGYILHELVRRYSNMVKDKNDILQEIESVKYDYQTYSSKFNNFKDGYQCRISILQTKVFNLENLCDEKPKLLEEEQFFLEEANVFRKYLSDKLYELFLLEKKLTKIDTDFNDFVCKHGNADKLKVFLDTIHHETVDNEDFLTVKNGIKSMIDQIDIDISRSNVIIDELKKNCEEKNVEEPVYTNIHIDDLINLKNELLEKDNIINNLNKELSLKSSNITTLNIKVGDLESLLDKTKLGMNTLTDKYDSLKELFNDLDKKFKCINIVSEELKTAVFTKDITIHNLKELNNELMTQIENNDKHDSKYSIITDLQAHNEFLLEENEKQMKEISDLAYTNECIQLQLDQLLNKINLLMVEISSIKDDKDKLNEKISSLNLDKHNLNIQITNLNNEIVDLKNNHMKQDIIDSLVKDKENLNTIIDNLTAELVNLKNNETELILNNENLNIQITNLNNEIVDLKNNHMKQDIIDSLVKDKENLNTIIDNLTAELVDLKNNSVDKDMIDSLIKDKENLNTIIDTLTAELVDLKNNSVDKDMIDSLVKDKENLNTIINTLAAELVDLKNNSGDKDMIDSLIKDKENLNTIIDTLTAELVDLKNNSVDKDMIDSLVKDKENLNTIINTLAAELVDLKNNSGDKDMIDSLVKDKENLNTIIDNLTAELVDLKNNSVDKDMIDSLVKDKQNLNTIINTLAAELVDLKNNSGDKDMIDSFTSETVHPSECSEHDEHEMFENESELSKLNKSLNEEKALVQHYKLKFESLEKDLKILVDEYEKSTTMSDKMRVEILDLQSKLRICECKNDNFDKYKHTSDELRSKLINLDIRLFIDTKLKELSKCEEEISALYISYVKGKISSCVYYQKGLPILLRKEKVISDIENFIDIIYSHINI
jgi:chromosome segregation ATPase